MCEFVAGLRVHNAPGLMWPLHRFRVEMGKIALVMKAIALHDLRIRRNA